MEVSLERTYYMKRYKRVDCASPSEIHPAPILAVITFHDGLNKQQRRRLSVQIEYGTLWIEYITGKVGGVGQCRHPAVHGINRHTGIVATVPEDELYGIVRRGQR